MSVCVCMCSLNDLVVIQLIYSHCFVLLIDWSILIVCSKMNRKNLQLFIVQIFVFDYLIFGVECVSFTRMTLIDLDTFISL